MLMMKDEGLRRGRQLFPAAMWAQSRRRDGEQDKKVSLLYRRGRR